MTGFFVIRLKRFFLVFSSGKYLEILSCCERWLKKNLQILSSNEWNDTVNTIPFWLTILADASKLFESSLISLFTKILKAWKTFVAGLVFYNAFFLLFLLYQPNPEYLNFFLPLKYNFFGYKFWIFFFPKIPKNSL